MRRTDIETERSLASLLDAEETGALRDRLTQLTNVLYRADQAAERHAHPAAPAHPRGPETGAPDLSVLTTVSDAQLLALHATTVEEHDTWYRTVRRIQTP